MKYWPLVWSALWRRPAEAILVWLAVMVSFALFALMVGLHATYDQLIAHARLDRLYVNARFPSASAIPRESCCPLPCATTIMRVKGVSDASAVYFVRGYYRDPALARISHGGGRTHARGVAGVAAHSAQWDQLLATPDGVFVTHSRHSWD